MPWGARDTMSLRTEFVLFASQDGANIRALCRHYGISPATGYKWLRRWADDGLSGLHDRPRTPRHSPNRSSDDIADLLRMAHSRHERWGPARSNAGWKTTRLSLCLMHCPDERRETVQQQLVGVFERYGLPDRMTMDNGEPWGDTTGTWTALELWLMRLGIRVSHSRPYHPQTQGKLERFHHSLKAEVLQGKWFADSSELQRAFDHWRTAYNLEQPHEGLDMTVPASRYQPSAR